jgi:hypothetical protein
MSDAGIVRIASAQRRSPSGAAVSIDGAFERRGTAEERTLARRAMIAANSYWISPARGNPRTTKGTTAYESASQLHRLFGNVKRNAFGNALSPVK